MDNEFIYFDTEKYHEAFKEVENDKFIDLLHEAETKDPDGSSCLSQKIVYEYLKKKKGIYYRINVLFHFEQEKRNIRIKNDYDCESILDENITDKQKISILKQICNQKLFSIIFNILKIKNVFDVIEYKISKNEIPLSKWIIENSEEHYKNNTHFFELISPEFQIYYKKYFENFTYPVLSENILKYKLENAIYNGNLFLVNYWLKKKRIDNIVISISRDSFDLYRCRIVELLIVNGYLEDGEWTELSVSNCNGSLFEPLFELYTKKSKKDKFMKELEVFSKGNEIEIINFLVQKLKK